jgi:23S rRNA pseudouridine1911/1915/1917 synthase
MPEATREPGPSLERREVWLVDPSEDNLRLDVALSLHFDDLSRAQAKRWIDEGRVRLGGKSARASRICREGDVVEVAVPAPRPAIPLPESVPLEIVHEDRHLVVVNKPSGMVVHPAPGHSSGTLVNALLAHTRDLSGIGGVLRPGIVHRLDAGTSGLLVVAKSDPAHRHLAAQFQNRTVTKRYLAIVHGTPPERLSIDRPIGRDPRHRKKISSRARAPRAARSEVERLELLPGSALLEIRIATGRTHQIRVHLSESGYPVAGDREYGAPRTGAGPRAGRSASAVRLLRGFERPALHAFELAFEHPASGERVSFQARLPPDMAELLEKLRGLL